MYMDDECSGKGYYHSSLSRAKANELLAKAKERDAQRDLVPVMVDEKTVKLMPRKKAEKYFKTQVK
jgi:hypothetical protein